MKIAQTFEWPVNRCTLPWRMYRLMSVLSFRVKYRGVTDCRHRPGCCAVFARTILNRQCRSDSCRDLAPGNVCRQRLATAQSSRK